MSTSATLESAPAWRAEADALRRRWEDQHAHLFEDWRRLGLVTDRSLHHIIDEGARKFGDVSLVFQTPTAANTVRLDELYEQSKRLANGLAALGLGSGDVMLVQSRSWHEAILSFMAAIRLGAVLAPVVHIFGPSEIAYIAGHSGAKILVLPELVRDEPIADRLKEMGPLPTVKRVVSIGGRTDGFVRSWDSLFEAHPDVAPADTAATDVCAMLFTSGTTSKPKGVMHTHRSLAAETIGASSFMPRGKLRPFLNTLLAGHIGGLNGTIRPYYYGITSIYMERWDADLAADLIKRYGIGWSNGAPYHLNTLLNTGLNADNCHLRSFVTGAANVPPLLIERSLEAGLGGTRSYGSTEHPTVTVSTADDPPEKCIWTDGRPIGGNRIRIVDDNGQDLASGQPGEVLTVGPEQMLGYINSEMNAEAYTEDGWFRTGDIGVIDAEGFLTMVDRKKDIIIRGGENISSKEVEDIAARHPAVMECAVVGYRDISMGERVALCVRLHPGQAITLEEVAAHFADAKVARQKTPERLLVLEADFPRTPSGKIVKTRLREMLDQESEPAAASGQKSTG